MISFVQLVPSELKEQRFLSSQSEWHTAGVGLLGDQSNSDNGVGLQKLRLNTKECQYLIFLCTK